MARQAVGALLRGLGCARIGGAPSGAGILGLKARELSGTAGAYHVNPAEENVPDQQAGEPRWLRELGAIRTDWT